MDEPPAFCFRGGSPLLGWRSWPNIHGGEPVLSDRRSQLPYTPRSRLRPYSGPPFSPEVHLGGRALAKPLVRSLGVVEAEIAAQAPTHLRSVGIVPQIDVFVLHRAPPSIANYVPGNRRGPSPFSTLSMVFSSARPNR